MIETHNSVQRRMQWHLIFDQGHVARNLSIRFSIGVIAAKATHAGKEGGILLESLSVHVFPRAAGQRKGNQEGCARWLRAARAIGQQHVEKQTRRMRLELRMFPQAPPGFRNVPNLAPHQPTSSARLFSLALALALFAFHRRSSF